jgi:LysR family glycine cleavage system transcriptional activator
MARRLPPLNGLRAFEASARYLSFTKAAEELNVTPAAVSQQVKSLEEYFGVQLFKRLTRALMLTDSGQLVLPILQEGFDKLAEADRILRSRQDNRILTVSVAPSFGAKWLVPKLDSFRRAYPDYDIRIDATDARADFRRDNVDIALRYGLGQYPGLMSECLMTEIAVPVCNPRLQEGEHPLQVPDDLRHHTLLHIQWKMESDAAPNWRMWLKAAGLHDIDPDRGPQFSMESMAIQAAIEGQGVSLISTALVEEDIASGRLVRPFPEDINQQTKFCYFLVYPESHLQRPKVAAFRDWVQKQIEPQEAVEPAHLPAAVNKR